ncbi:Pentatricopeptide repeat-containing protein [Thalictrum thalictroides]|uniref:Pentatricopeptide repeat-containing protein n=1 Tax=Thalictrum thalictroides TaxID=46969 RepID=A0A7J6X7N8_THATH|nr:Pentatricopeptide repeat-containing protein [Thalictrum thalictroides]
MFPAMVTVKSVSISILPAKLQLPPNEKFLHHSVPIQLNKFKFKSFCIPQQQLHGVSGLPHTNTLAYNNLMSLYIKGDRLEEARKLFDYMSQRNEESWSIIISAYTHSGNFVKALNMFERMMWDGWKPNEFVLGCVIKASSELREVSVGRQLHGWLIRSGFGLGVSTHTFLMTMYSNCGFLDDARRVFDEIPISFLDDFSLWNTIINVHMYHECWTEVFSLFVYMVSIGIVEVTIRIYASIISACSNARIESYGEILHGRIVKDGILNETIIGNSLITFYAKCGNIEEANRLFLRMSKKDVVSWNSVIAGNEQNGEYETAMNLFHRMLRMEIPTRPNRITFLSALSAISGTLALKHGRATHAHIIRSGLLCNTSIANSLINMYSKCKEVNKAKLVFDKLSFKDMVSWNSMLSGYEQNEQSPTVFKLFKEMLLSGTEPDNHSFTVVLSASSSLQSEFKCLSVGKAVHGYVLKRIPPWRLGISTNNAILTMYAKNNRVAEAEKIFEELIEKDSYTWNAMMDGYSVSGSFDKSVRVFLEMHEQGLSSDYMTFSILLTVCSGLVSINLGKQFHALIVKHIGHRGFTHRTSLLSIHNALISMYAKCGSISDADRVFIRMRSKDVFSWTAMITAYAHHGMAIESFELFEKMKQDAIKPNAVTFLGLLTACAHSGFVEEGIHYFSSMSHAHGLNPSIEHYACMVDLFGRTGQLKQAENFLEAGMTLFKKKHGDCLNLWKVLLGACHAHKQLELGVRAAMKILESEPEDETTHTLLLNLYAASGMWEDTMKVRSWMRDKGLKKQEIGCSWIEAGNKRHLFVAGDIFHPQRKEIYVKLEEINSGCRKMGYVPMTEYVLHDVDESQKEAIIGCHSEKLAVSFGLLQNGQGSKGVIRVMKNLRICGDCHNWMKYSSKLEGRSIVVRDSRRFHFFKDGSCSCRDYW